MKLFGFNISISRGEAEPGMTLQQAREEYLYSETVEGKTLRRNGTEPEDIHPANLPAKYNHVKATIIIDGKHADTPGEAKELQAALNKWNGTDHWGSTQG